MLLAQESYVWYAVYRSKPTTEVVLSTPRRCEVKMFWIVVLIALGGCASIDHFQIANDCNARKRLAEESQASCKEAIGSTTESCTEQFPEINCDVEWEAWNKQEESRARREAKRSHAGRCSEQGLVEYCSNVGCTCITRQELVWRLQNIRW